MTISEQLDRIGDDILNVLNESRVPLTQGEIYEKRQLKNLSYYGWSFALEILEKNNEVRFTDGDRWRLTTYEEKAYIKSIENFTGQKIKCW